MNAALETGLEATRIVKINFKLDGLKADKKSKKALKQAGERLQESMETLYTLLDGKHGLRHLNEDESVDPNIWIKTPYSAEETRSIIDNYFNEISTANAQNAGEKPVIYKTYEATEHSLTDIDPEANAKHADQEFTVLALAQ